MKSIYNSNQWLADLDRIIAEFRMISELEGKSVLITGAAGLVCSAFTDILIRYNETHDGKIKILAAGRWKDEMTDRFGIYSNRDYFTYIPYDATKTSNTFDIPSDYIIHGASNASPSMIAKEPVETLLSNCLGIKMLLDYALGCGAQRILYISSSEVYGKKNDNKPFHEGEYGFIDQLNPRNSYSVGKRAAETLCASYADEYGVSTVIVRPGHIYGPTASKNDNRVSSVWSYNAAEGKNIVMKSDGTQLRSYCYCLDCASAILTVLLRGKETSAYNISNPNAIISIRELAETLAEAGKVEVVYEIPSDSERRSFNPMSNSSLDSTSLEKLGWKGIFDAKAGLSHTVKVLCDMSAES